MKKISFLLLFALSAFFTTAGFSQSTSEEKQQIKTLVKELKGLPKNASAATVTELAKKLATLDPLRANKYYTMALNKLVASDANKVAAKELAVALKAIVGSSNLSTSQKQKLAAVIDKSEAKFSTGTYDPGTDGADESEEGTTESTNNQNSVDTTLDPSPANP